MKIDKEKVRNNCLVCEKEMKTGINYQATSKPIRYLTCSKKCSKILQEIRKHVVRPYRDKIKKLEEELKRK